MKRKTATLALIILAATCAIAKAAQEQSVMMISFGKPLTDQEILAFLRTYDARPYAVYMTAGDMNGIHRVAPHEAAYELLAEARDATSQGAEQRLRDSQEDLAAFAEAVTTEKFLSSPSLQEQGRSRLIHEHQDRIVLQSASRNAPLIYAVEVVVNSANVYAVARNLLVKESNVGFMLAGRTVVNRPKPASTLREGSKARSLDAVSLYHEIQNAAARIRKGGNLEF